MLCPLKPLLEDLLELVLLDDLPLLEDELLDLLELADEEVAISDYPRFFLVVLVGLLLHVG